MTLDQAIEKSMRSRRNLLKLIHSKRLPAKRIKRDYHIRFADLERWLPMPRDVRLH